MTVPRHSGVTLATKLPQLNFTISTLRIMVLGILADNVIRHLHYGRISSKYSWCNIIYSIILNYSLGMTRKRKLVKLSIAHELA